MHGSVVVVAGGEGLRPDVAPRVPANAHVLAADGGVAFALALGLRVDAVIGDLDSALPSDVEEAVASGARVERHPPDKDETDLELALDAALALDPDEILVLADDGGRLDHTLSALLLLAAPRYARCSLDAQFGRALVHVVRDERELAGEPGEIVSLLAVDGPAEGVRTDGLAFPLAGETLQPGSSRGVSNVFLGESARVSLEQGVLLVVRPGPEIEEREKAK
jgi:thiamine pyrophosphokinase